MKVQFKNPTQSDVQICPGVVYLSAEQPFDVDARAWREDLEPTGLFEEFIEEKPKKEKVK